MEIKHYGSFSAETKNNTFEIEEDPPRPKGTCIPTSCSSITFRRSKTPYYTILLTVFLGLAVGLVIHSFTSTASSSSTANTANTGGGRASNGGVVSATTVPPTKEAATTTSSSSGAGSSGGSGKAAAATDSTTNTVPSCEKLTFTDKMHKGTYKANPPNPENKHQTPPTQQTPQ
mmetsp:Transcript_23978/g.42494  ORF Transcript_23978/g.42494 Transcript_23978/m.42494 type:complete len:174 (-) Transcript_23978:101-622(-)